MTPSLEWVSVPNSFLFFSFIFCPQSCQTLCDPMDCSLPGSSLHGILQARVLEWVAISFSRGSSQPRDQTRVSLIPGRCFNLWATREAHILSYLLSKRMGCLSGCLVSSAIIQKLFCGICSAFKYSFDEFVGEKVVSPSYSSTILGPPLHWSEFNCPTSLKFNCSIIETHVIGITYSQQLEKLYIRWVHCSLLAALWCKR